MTDRKPIVVVSGELNELSSSDYLAPNKVNIANNLIIPVLAGQSGAGEIVYDATTETIQIDFGAGLKVVGWPGVQYYGTPVADFSSLPLTDIVGTIRVTLSDSLLYVWNGAAWVSADNYIHPPATENDITGAVVTGSLTGEIIISSDTFRIYIWDGAAWQLASSSLLVKNELGAEIVGVSDIISTKDATGYVNGTGLTFDLSLSGASLVKHVGVTVVPISPYDTDIFSIETVPVISGAVVTVRIFIGYSDSINGVFIYDELNVSENPPFDGSFIDNVTIRAMVQ